MIPITVKACPKRCTFDWVKFHKDLDIAMAHLITESDPYYYHNDNFGLPSYTTLMQMAEYSNEKRKLQEAKK